MAAPFADGMKVLELGARLGAEPRVLAFRVLAFRVLAFRVLAFRGIGRPGAGGTGDWELVLAVAARFREAVVGDHPKVAGGSGFEPEEEPF